MVFDFQGINTPVYSISKYTVQPTLANTTSSYEKKRACTYLAQKNLLGIRPANMVVTTCPFPKTQWRGNKYTQTYSSEVPNTNIQGIVS